ncbi:MAG: metal-sulfur cluster assembly factor [Planctomycetota bacterium]|nr:MAG: metal-sulfur cluster assembly factor [Planctomycetota bacterium]
MPAIRGTRSHDVKIDAGGVWIRLRSGHGIDGPVTQPIGYPGSPHVETPESESLTLPSVPATGATDGAAPVEATALTTAASDTAPLCEDRVRELLKTVKDPELFVNIVDLGLIYGVTLAPSAEVSGKQQVSIDMTMTSPACPAGPQLIGDTKRALAAHPAVAGVEVRIVMDPPWTPDRMTDDARDFLGIF